MRARSPSGREPDPVFAARLGRTRPLTDAVAVRTILGLDHPDRPGTMSPVQATAGAGRW